MRAASDVVAGKEDKRVEEALCAQEQSSRQSARGIGLFHQKHDSRDEDDILQAPHARELERAAVDKHPGQHADKHRDKRQLVNAAGKLVELAGVPVGEAQRDAQHEGKEDKRETDLTHVGGMQLTVAKVSLRGWRTGGVAQVELMHRPPKRKNRKRRHEQVDETHHHGWQIARNQREQTGKRQGRDEVEECPRGLEAREEIHPHAAAPHKTQSARDIARHLKRGALCDKLQEVERARRGHENKRSPDQDVAHPRRQLAAQGTRDQKQAHSAAQDVGPGNANAKISRGMQVVQVVLIPEAQDTDADKGKREVMQEEAPENAGPAAHTVAALIAHTSLSPSLHPITER